MPLARKAFIVSVVVVAVVVGALALWKIRLVIALLFVALTIAAAMRPGGEGVPRRGIPRAIGVALHYLPFLALIGLLLWLIVPTAISQVQHAIGGGEAHAQLRQAAAHTSGIEHDLLVGIDRRLRHCLRAPRW